jgi:prevent-host-death family protein
MKISTKELRMQPGRIISQVQNGSEITITYHGKALAKIVSLHNKREIYEESEAENELFGIWKNNTETEDVGEYVRSIRKGRQF